MRFQKPNNLKVVLYCIITASTFWFFSALNKHYDATVEVPVTWIFDLDKYIVVNELPENVQVNVSGIGWNLLRTNSGLGFTPITLRLNEPVSKRRLPASYFENQIAEELEQLQLNYIIEDSLHFNIDFRKTQSFPVFIDSLGMNLKNEFRIISKIDVDTSFISIEGPSEVLKRMVNDTFWVHVLETNIDENFRDNVLIEMPFPELMHSTPPSINVSFNVAKFIEKEIQIPIIITGQKLDPKVYLKDSLTTLHYTIQEEFQDSIRADLFQITADFKLISKKDSTLTLELTTSSTIVINPYINTPKKRVYYHE